MSGESYIKIARLDGSDFTEVDHRQWAALEDAGAIELQGCTWTLTPDPEYPGSEEEQVMDALARMGRIG